MIHVSVAEKLGIRLQSGQIGWQNSSDTPYIWPLSLVVEQESPKLLVEVRFLQRSPEFGIDGMVEIQRCPQ